MKQIQREIKVLDKHYGSHHIPIWFDAWRHETNENVWAALLHTVTSEIEKTKSVSGVLFSRIRLAWNNIDRITKFVFKLIFILVSGYYLAFLMESIIVPNNQQKLVFITWEGATIFGVSLIGSFWNSIGNLFSPLGINLKQIIKGKSFAAKVENVHTFTNDLQVVINNSLKKKGRVVLYIDDLDRCSPKNIVGVVEAINQFLDLKNCVFILGMDNLKVSESLGYEYRKLDGDESKNDREKSIEFGQEFLEKIIQLPIKLPNMSKDDVVSLSEHIIHSHSPDYFSSKIYPNKSDVKDEKIELTNMDFPEELKTDIREIILYLDKKNPRAIKRFVNKVWYFYLLSDIGKKLFDNLDNKMLPLWLLWNERFPQQLKDMKSTAHKYEWTDMITGFANTSPEMEELYKNIVADIESNEIVGSWLTYPDHGSFDEYYKLTDHVEYPSYKNNEQVK